MRIRSSSRTAPFLVPFFVSACGGSPSPAPEAPSAHPHDHAHHDGHAHGAGGPDTLVHRFERADEWAKTFDDPARDAWQKPADVVKAMSIAPGMTVADLGAGTGYFEPWLARAVGSTGSVLALDVEVDMVRYMKERGAREGWTNVRAAEVASDDPKLAPASVDRILIVDTWHHIANRGAYAAKLKSALKPGGQVIIVDFTLAAPHGPPPAHRLAPDAVIAELRAGGIEARVVPVDLPDQYVVVGR